MYYDEKDLAMDMMGHNVEGQFTGKGKSMYAIVFDLDTNSLKEVYSGPSWNNAYQEIRAFLADRGFDWQQGSTYFGNDTVSAVDCVLGVQEMADNFDWFAASVRDIRMLRIEENNDLMPVVTLRRTGAR